MTTAPGGAARRRKGDRFERLTSKRLKTQGWVVVRSAGSLGCADLVAFRSDHAPWFISCKAIDTPYLRPTEWLALYETALSVNGVPVVAYPAATGIDGVTFMALMAPARGRQAIPPLRRLDTG